MNLITKRFQNKRLYQPAVAPPEKLLQFRFHNQVFTDAPPGGLNFTRWRGNSIVSCDMSSGSALGRDVWNHFYEYCLVPMSEIRVQVSYLNDAPVDPVTVCLLPLSSTVGITGSIDQVCELPKAVWRTVNRQGNGAVITLTNTACLQQMLGPLDVHDMRHDIYGSGTTPNQQFYWVLAVQGADDDVKLSI